MNKDLIFLYKVISAYSPRFIRKKLSKCKEKKELEIGLARMKRTKVSKEEIKSVIDQLEIGDCDVMLHTSMMNIGKMQGGIKWFCNCFFEKINIDKNTLLVSALPYRGRFKDYLESNPVFDVRTAPIEMGAINEYIALIPESKRSIHPTHSVVALGKQSIEYTNEHHLDNTPFGKHSPYYKLLRNRGKIVLFGATMNNITYIHVLEDVFGNQYPFKIYDKKKYRINCFSEKGEKIVVETPCHNTWYGLLRGRTSIKNDLISNNIIKCYSIGESEVLLLDVYSFSLYILNKMKKGWTIYGKMKVDEKLTCEINRIIKTI